MFISITTTDAGIVVINKRHISALFQPFESGTYVVAMTTDHWFHIDKAQFLKLSDELISEK